ncbi:MAG: dihydrofolate reductase family protein [Dehalococcoidia bacterium]
MRTVCYGGAMSLDGYIAGPHGEHDWIPMDPDMDFAAMTARYDTFLVGRRTLESMRAMGSDAVDQPGLRHIVCSRTMRAADHPQLTITADAVQTLSALRAAPGRDIAVFGGGDLFRSLLGAGLVDEIGVSVVPVLLGGGTPFLPAPAATATLRLRTHRLYDRTGIVALTYDIAR